MTRWCVNATVEVDAWAYVDAGTAADAMDEAEQLTPSDFELGDPLHVTVVSAEPDA